MTATRPSVWDDLARDLADLRVTAGNPSYAEIARRIGDQRERAGAQPGTARPGRTTVYDTFRTGRRRVDTGLVVEIVRALGADEDEVEQWSERCRDALRASAREVPAVPTAPVAPREPGDTGEPGDSGKGAPTPPTDTARPTEGPDDGPDDNPTDGGETPAVRPRPSGFVPGLLVLCVLLNLAGRVTVDQLQLPIFLDMVGTAVAAVLLGPWWGVSVGLTTNLVGVATSGPLSIPVAAVNVAGALVWGYGVHRWGLGRTVPRYFLLNIIAGAVCSLVATPIIIAVSVDTGHAADLSVQRLLTITHVLVLSVFFTNLVVSLADKMVCGFVALAVAEAVPRPWWAPDGGRRRPERPAPSVPGFGPTP